MLTIAGGILIAILVVVTFPLWAPLLGWLIVIAFWLIVGAIVITLVVNFPEESLVVGIVFAVVFVAGFISEFFNVRSEARKNKKRDFIHTKIKEELSSAQMKVKMEYITPECLAASKDKIQMINLANELGITVAESDSRTSIARKIFGVKSEIAESDSRTSKYRKIFDIKNESTEKIIKGKINIEDDKNETDEEKISILEKIDRVREKEKARLKDEKNKAEEKKRKENELMTERFLIINKALKELKITYAKDKGINIAVSELSALLTLGESSDYSRRTINIHPDRYGKGFYIIDGFEDRYESNEHETFNCSEKVIDFIIEEVGKFLAERESR